MLSTHKTLPAFTQSALLLARADSLDLRRLAEAFDLLNTTSPSGAIYASIDRARALLEHARRGAARPHAGARPRASARRWPAIDGILMMRPDAPAVHAIDPTKIVVSLDGTGADGFAVEADGYEAGIRFEMADRSLLVPLLHVGVADAWVDRLLEFLPASIERRRGTPRPPRASIAFTADPEPGMSPREAFFAEHERVPVARRGRPHLRGDRDALPARHPRARAGRGRDGRRDRRAARRTRSRIADRLLQRPGLDTLLVVVR